MRLIYVSLRLLGFPRHISVWVDLIYRRPILTHTYYRVPIILPIRLNNREVVRLLPQEFGFSFCRMVMSHARYSYFFCCRHLSFNKNF